MCANSVGKVVVFFAFWFWNGRRERQWEKREAMKSSWVDTSQVDRSLQPVLTCRPLSPEDKSDMQPKAIGMLSDQIQGSLMQIIPWEGLSLMHGHTESNDSLENCISFFLWILYLWKIVAPWASADIQVFSSNIILSSLVYDRSSTSIKQPWLIRMRKKYCFCFARIPITNTAVQMMMKRTCTKCFSYNYVFEATRKTY